MCCFLNWNWLVNYALLWKSNYSNAAGNSLCTFYGKHFKLQAVIFCERWCGKIEGKSEVYCLPNFNTKPSMRKSPSKFIECMWSRKVAISFVRKLLCSIFLNHLKLDSFSDFFMLKVNSKSWILLVWQRPPGSLHLTFFVWKNRTPFVSTFPEAKKIHPHPFCCPSSFQIGSSLVFLLRNTQLVTPNSTKTTK